MEQPDKTQKQLSGKRPGSDKKSKKINFKIDEEIKIEVADIPENSIFKGYKSYDVQELITTTRTTRYMLAQWQTPDGRYITAKVPDSLKGYHYGPDLRKHIIYQHHFNRVPQSKIHKELIEKGIDISKGEIDRILISEANNLASEKESILDVGLHVSDYIQSDDTGARDQGKNAYCTIITNDLFAYFHTSFSKSRLNFLEILNSQNKAYLINDVALKYMLKQKLSFSTINLMTAYKETKISLSSEFEKLLKEYSLKENEIKTITEAALIGNLINNGFSEDIVILSDNAGQFNLFEHALCWIHAERHIRRIVPVGDKERLEVAKIRKFVWQLYKLLKIYKKKSTEQLKEKILIKFEKIFTYKVICKPLSNVLSNIYKNKSELLKVLEKPFVPLHNNVSEQNIRDFVIKRKISGGSRSNAGRKARDILNSIMQTCFKHEISFWKYLDDRIKKLNTIPLLVDLIKNASSFSGP